MLHRSNAESALWKEGDSPGEAAGQSWEGCSGGGGAGIWPGVVFNPAQECPGDRKDLLGSLQDTTN